jgi:hypothetical protein
MRPYGARSTPVAHYTQLSLGIKLFLSEVLRFGGSTGKGTRHGRNVWSLANVSIKLPKTLTVKTGTGRLHKYYKTHQPENIKIVDQDKNTFADIQGQRKQIVAPGSMHPDTKKPYEIPYSLAAERTDSSLKIVDSTFDSVRKICSELRPPVLDNFGLLAALEWQAEDFKNRTQILCKFTSYLEEVSLNRDRSTAVFRIFQEALTNVARHAKATSGFKDD